MSLCARHVNRVSILGVDRTSTLVLETLHRPFLKRAIGVLPWRTPLWILSDAYRVVDPTVSADGSADIFIVIIWFRWFLPVIREFEHMVWIIRVILAINITRRKDKIPPLFPFPSLSSQIVWEWKQNMAVQCRKYTSMLIRSASYYS